MYMYHYQKIIKDGGPKNKNMNILHVRINRESNVPEVRKMCNDVCS